MFAHAFVRNAYLAGTFIALACGTVGWFAVLRGQVFAGDALSHVAFVGAIAAAVLGVDERIGLFALTLALAAGLGAAGDRVHSDDTLIGITFAWVLGIGVLLLAILGLALTEDLQRINALKNVLALIVNLVAGVVFVLVAHVAWAPALLLMAGSVVGGQLGARAGRRLPAGALRGFIVVVGLVAIAQLVTR